MPIHKMSRAPILDNSSEEERSRVKETARDNVNQIKCQRGLVKAFLRKVEAKQRLEEVNEGWTEWEYDPGFGTDSVMR